MKNYGTNYIEDVKQSSHLYIAKVAEDFKVINYNKLSISLEIQRNNSVAVLLNKFNYKVKHV